MKTEIKEQLPKDINLYHLYAAHHGHTETRQKQLDRTYYGSKYLIEYYDWLQLKWAEFFQVKGLNTQILYPKIDLAKWFTRWLKETVTQHEKR